MSATSTPTPRDAVDSWIDVVRHSEYRAGRHTSDHDRSPSRTPLRLHPDTAPDHQPATSASNEGVPLDVMATSSTQRQETEEALHIEDAATVSSIALCSTARGPVTPADVPPTVGSTDDHVYPLGNGSNLSVMVGDTPGASFTYSSSDVSPSKRTDQKYRCTHCLVQMSSDVKGSHEAGCVEVLVQCPLGCSRRFPRREIPHHVKTTWRHHDPDAIDVSHLNAEDPRRVAQFLLSQLIDLDAAGGMARHVLDVTSRTRQTLEWLRENHPAHHAALNSGVFASEHNRIAQLAARCLSPGTISFHEANSDSIVLEEVPPPRSVVPRLSTATSDILYDVVSAAVTPQTPAKPLEWGPTASPMELSLKPPAPQPDAVGGRESVQARPEAPAPPPKLELLSILPDVQDLTPLSLNEQKTHLYRTMDALIANIHSITQTLRYYPNTPQQDVTRVDTGVARSVTTVQMQLADWFSRGSSAGLATLQLDHELLQATWARLDRTWFLWRYAVYDRLYLA